MPERAEQRTGGGWAAKVLVVMRMEVEAVDHSRWEGREGREERKVITSCKFLEEKFRECNAREGSGYKRQCGHARHGFEDEGAEAGSKGEMRGERKCM